jgi:L-lactate dehydrogenase
MEECVRVFMKVGIVGAGAVGTACMFAMALRGSAREIVLVNRNFERARAAVTDLQYGTLLAPTTSLRAGSYADLRGAAIVVITAGANEKAGGATDRNDSAGRLKLLGTNAAVYRDIVPRIIAAAPEALLVVVTDPPDPLAHLARRIAGHDRVLSAGTFLDSLRLQFHLGKRLDVDPRSVHAQVVGEHGTSQVYLWSTANIGGTRILPTLLPQGLDADSFRSAVDDDVRYANINIIEGTGASQLGIGVATARIVEIAGGEEQTVIPIGSYHDRYGTTLSLPSQFGRNGVTRVLIPPLAADEARAVEDSAAALRDAVQSIES